MFARWRHEDEQDRVGGQHRNDRESVAVLEDGGQQVAASAGRAELVGGGDDRRNARGDIFGVESGPGLAVDEQAVAAEHDGGVDAFALPDGGDQISNARHHVSPGKWWRS